MAAQAACPPPDLMNQVRGELLQLLSAEFQSLAARCVEACVHQVWTACLTSLAAAPQPPPVSDEDDLAAVLQCNQSLRCELPGTVESSFAAEPQSQFVCNDGDAAADGSVAPLQSALPSSAKIVAEGHHYHRRQSDAPGPRVAAALSGASDADSSFSTDDSTSTEDSAPPADVAVGGASSSSALADTSALQAEDTQAVDPFASANSGDSTAVESSSLKVQCLRDPAEDAEGDTAELVALREAPEVAVPAEVPGDAERPAEDEDSARQMSLRHVLPQTYEFLTREGELKMNLVEHLDYDLIPEASASLGEYGTPVGSTSPNITARETRRHIDDLEQLCGEEQSLRDASDLPASCELEGSRSLHKDVELRIPIDALPHEDTDCVLDTAAQTSPNVAIDAEDVGDNTVEVQGLRQRADPDVQSDTDEQPTVDQELQALQQVMETLARQLTLLDTEAECAAALAHASAKVSRGSAIADCPEPASGGDTTGHRSSCSGKACPVSTAMMPLCSEEFREERQHFEEWLIGLVNVGADLLHKRDHFQRLSETFIVNGSPAGCASMATAVASAPETEVLAPTASTAVDSEDAVADFGHEDEEW